MKRFFAGLALGVALTALAGIAYASIPDGGGVVHTCYGNNSWRPIDYPKEQCKANETALNLNQTGPQGPQGQQGPQGIQGVQGPQGNPGVFNGSFTSPNGQYSISVTDAGIVLSGNGSSINLSGPNVSISSSSAVNVSSSGAVNVTAQGQARFGGAVTTLCPGATAGLMVAREADMVTFSGPIGFISPGTSTVTAC